MRELFVRLAPDGTDPRDIVAWSEPAELAAGLPEVRALFAPFPPREGWAGARSLELIQLAGAGADHLLPSPDLPAHVRVAGLRGLFADEAAEHAVLMMLALARDLPGLLEQQRQRAWFQRPVPKLAGERLAVLGLGAIGRGVAMRAFALGMDVVGVSRTAAPVEHVARVHPPEALCDALAGARYVVITLPLTPATRGLVDARALASLPRGAYVVHLGRGGVLDEAALREALEQGTIAGAALDVLEDEPPPPEHPIWDLPRTIITPHHAGFGLRYVERALEVFAENLRRLDEGAPLVGLIDRARGY